MKWSLESVEEEGSIVSAQSKRNKLCKHELDELREHIDLISFNILKVYHHARDRSKKEFNKSKNNFKKKTHHSQRNGKKIFQ